MKLSFFAAVMLAINASAVRVMSLPETHDFDTDFAEVEAHGQGKSHGKAELDAAVESAVASAADQIIKVNIPECQQGPKAEQLILQAVDDLSTKANELKQAMEISCSNKRPCPAPVAVPVPVAQPCCNQAPVMVARPACGAGIVGGCGVPAGLAGLPAGLVGGCGGVPALMGPGGVPVIQVCQGAKKEGEGDAKPAEAK